jgi:hypothetical protein
VTTHLQSQVASLEKLLAEDDHIDLVAAELGLAGPRGPQANIAPREPQAARRLAVQHAEDALPRAARELRAYGLRTIGLVPWPVELDDPQLDREAADIGLPLLGALAPTALHAATRLIFASRLPKPPKDRPRLLAVLTEILLEEIDLWRTAAAAGAQSRQIPYTYRRLLIEWFWNPAAHQARTAYCLCLRCGTPLHTHGHYRTGQHEPRCTPCMKEADRSWPDHALAPAGRGTWWLRCSRDNCAAVFEGQRNRRLCDRHQLRKVTPSQRPHR